jgi:hypothetical protein
MLRSSRLAFSAGRRQTQTQQRRALSSSGLPYLYPMPSNAASAAASSTSAGRGAGAAASSAGGGGGRAFVKLLVAAAVGGGAYYAYEQQQQDGGDAVKNQKGTSLNAALTSPDEKQRLRDETRARMAAQRAARPATSSSSSTTTSATPAFAPTTPTTTTTAAEGSSTRTIAAPPMPDPAAAAAAAAEHAARIQQRKQQQQRQQQGMRRCFTAANDALVRATAADASQRKQRRHAAIEMRKLDACTDGLKAVVKSSNKPRLANGVPASIAAALSRHHAALRTAVDALNESAASDAHAILTRVVTEHRAHRWQQRRQTAFDAGGDAAVALAAAAELKHIKAQLDAAAAILEGGGGGDANDDDGVFVDAELVVTATTAARQHFRGKLESLARQHSAAFDATLQQAVNVSSDNVAAVAAYHMDEAISSLVKEVSSKYDVVLQDAETEMKQMLRRRRAIALTQKKAAHAAGLAAERDERAARFDALDARAQHLQHAYRTQAQYEQVHARLHRLSLALLSLDKRLDDGDAFERSWETLTRAAAGDELLALAVASVPSPLTTTGVSTRAWLLQRFDDSERDWRSEAYTPTYVPDPSDADTNGNGNGNGNAAATVTVWGLLMGKVFGALTLSERRMIAGGGDQECISRAGFALENGDLATAAREIATLSERPGAAAAAWLQAASDRLCVEQALAIVRAHTTVLTTAFAASADAVAALAPADDQ